VDVFENSDTGIPLFTLTIYETNFMVSEIPPKVAGLREALINDVVYFVRMASQHVSVMSNDMLQVVDEVCQNVFVGRVRKVFVALG
jgi:hypothetical protein